MWQDENNCVEQEIVNPVTKGNSFLIFLFYAFFFKGLDYLNSAHHYEMMVSSFYQSEKRVVTQRSCVNPLSNL